MVLYIEREFVLYIDGFVLIVEGFGFFLYYIGACHARSWSKLEHSDGHQSRQERQVKRKASIYMKIFMLLSSNLHFSLLPTYLSSE